MTGVARASESVTAGDTGRPLRIAHFTMGRCNPESANGIDKVVYFLARAQAALGHDVTVYSLTDKQAIPIPGVRVVTYPPALRAPRWLGARARDLLVSRSPLNVPRALLRDLEAAHPDILHLHFVHVPQNLRLAHALAAHGVPYCVSLHGGLSPRALRRRRVAKRLFALLGERRYLRHAALLHIHSDDDVAGLRMFGVENRLIRTPNGFDLDRVPLEADAGAVATLAPDLDGKRIFIFVGRLDPEQKTLLEMVEAFARLDRTDTALLLVGPDWRGGAGLIRQRIEELHLDDRVLLPGPAFGARKFSLLRRSNVFVHASRWEGFPSAVLEAAGAGLPCLLSPACDPDGVFSRAGAAIAVEPTAEGITAGLRRFADLDAAALEEMGARARQLVAERFDWNVVAGTLVAAYREAIAVRP